MNRLRPRHLPSRRRSDGHRVMLCTSNGAGLGHVTRMLAVAEELGNDVEPMMFTLSAALPIPVETGLAVEHLPSAAYLDVPTQTWHALLEERVDHLIENFRPDTVLFDGVHPYRGFVDALGRHQKRLRRVWVRRGMWRSEVGPGALERSASFDEIIEPGDYAADYDRGAPSRQRSRVHRVAPIVYRGPQEALSREAACSDLGIDPSDVNVLVQLGAGTINDVHTVSGQVVSALSSHRVAPRICVGRSVLSKQDDDPAEVSIVRRYPISRYFAAFDAAIIAAGYNSFHECLSHAVPSIIVPNLLTKTDDQDGRSRWAADFGFALRWSELDGPPNGAIERILDPIERKQLIARMHCLPAASGSREVAELVESWVR